MRIAEALERLRRPEVPPPGDRFTVVSLFAGGGGSSLGYRYAGGKVLAAAEWDPFAARVYRHNMPETKVLEADLTVLEAQDLHDASGLGDAELDILDGSPPCQGFSTSGKRRMWDKRNELYVQQVRMLEHFKPRAMLMENVAGLVTGKMKLVFREMLRDIKAQGYKVTARLVDAAYFGVPQRRRRVIFVAVREDLGIEPSFPPALCARIPVRTALEGVEAVQFGKRLTDHDRHLWAAMEPGKRAADIPEFKGQRLWDVRKLDPRSPSSTILAQGAGSLFHWEEARRMSIEEIRRLASFPDDFETGPGSYAKQWAVLGNCVPPRFMEALASHVRDTVLEVRAAA